MKLATISRLITALALTEGVAQSAETASSQNFDSASFSQQVEKFRESRFSNPTYAQKLVNTYAVARELSDAQLPILIASVNDEPGTKNENIERFYQAARKKILTAVVADAVTLGRVSATENEKFRSLIDESPEQGLRFGLALSGKFGVHLSIEIMDLKNGSQYVGFSMYLNRGFAFQAEAKEVAEKLQVSSDFVISTYDIGEMLIRTDKSLAVIGCTKQMLRKDGGVAFLIGLHSDTIRADAAVQKIDFRTAVKNILYNEMGNVLGDLEVAKPAVSQALTAKGLTPGKVSEAVSDYIEMRFSTEPLSVFLAHLAEGGRVVGYQFTDKLLTEAVESAKKANIPLEKGAVLRHYYAALTELGVSVPLPQ